MKRGWAAFRDGLSVCLRRVAHVGLPTIIWIGLAGLRHECISVGFGQDACRRNARHLGVSLDDASVPRHPIFRNESVAVNQQVIWRTGQRSNGIPHGQKRRLQDVDFVNLLRPHKRHRPGNGFLFDFLSKTLQLAVSFLLSLRGSSRTFEATEHETPLQALKHPLPLRRNPPPRPWTTCASNP